MGGAETGGRAEETEGPRAPEVPGAPTGADAAATAATEEGAGGEAGTDGAPTSGDRLNLAGEALAEVAATLIEERPSPAAAGEVPVSDEPLSFAQCCERLGVSPYVLRRLMDDYEDVLPPLTETGAERRLPPEAVAMLARILGWRNEGLGRDEVLRRLRAGEADPSTGSGGGDGVSRLIAELGRLHHELQRSEARRAEDRDRLLTALMRNHQELQQLRYEMAVAKSRKERRKGFWARLFG